VTPVVRLLSPVRLLADLWRRRDLIRQFAVRYFLTRHRGTYLGAAWALLLPLLTLAVYSFVFNYVFTVRWGHDPNESPLEFALAMFCGMVVFNVFSDSTVRSVALVLGNPNYVKKVVFPIEILPVASVGSSLLSGGIGMLPVLAGTALFLGGLHWTLLLVPAVVLPLVALALGVSWLLASLGVFIRDMESVVGIVIGQILFFLTPIIYRPEHLPEQIRRIVMLNPLAVVVDAVRRTAMRGELPDWRALGWCLLASLVVMQLGYAWFMKTKRGFADVL